MTERFSIGDRVLQEVYDGCIPAILDGGIPCTQRYVLKLLNELDDENKCLKQLVDYAEDIIYSVLSKYFVRQWENYKKELKE